MTSRWAVPAAYVWIAACALLLFLRAYSYGPTTDPDPDGYVTYALHLQAGGGLLEWRRLPGYPALIALVDLMGPGSMHRDVFIFQIGLAALFLAASSYFILRSIGPLAACVYAVILAGPGYFARQSGVMVADFIAAMVLYGIVLALVAAVKATERVRKAAWCALLLLLICTGQLIHPSTDKRVMVLAVALLLAAAAVPFVQQPYFFGSAKKAAVTALLLISAALGAGYFSLAFQPHVPLKHFDYEAVHRSNSNLYEGWTLYRMFLCLPPAENSETDRRIEAVKAQIAARQGFGTDLSTPASFAPEFRELAREVEIPIDRWRPRLAAHPLALARCMASEVKRRYHHVLTNLLPFNNRVSYLSGPPPPQDASRESRTYWASGLDIRGTPANSTRAAFLEAVRCLISIALIIGGLVLIERRFPYWGIIAALWTIGWLIGLLTLQALETRYLVPLLPVFALGQALVVLWLLKTASAIGTRLWRKRWSAA